jgi:tyrosine-protein phosphatase SIW14
MLETVKRWFSWRRLGMTILAVGVVVAFFTIYEGAPQSVPENSASERTTERWLRIIRERAENGYWIVIRGTHIGDQVVAAGSAASFTHAAVYDKERDDIVEAVGSGVATTPLEELISQSHRVQIVRPRGYSREEGEAAVERARSRIGFTYDFLGTIGFQSDRSFYCTELALDAYRARERGWMPDGVIHPEHMTRYGRLVFDSGPRPSESNVVAISRELHDRMAARIDDARGVDYAALVAPGLYRGGQPDADGVQWLSSIGVKTVINLRHYHGDHERELVQAAGMRYVRIPLESTDPPTEDQVRRFLRVVNDPENQPVYVHCLHGVDRTGTMIAVYRMQHQGWSNVDALSEMEYFGAHSILHDLRRFVGSFTPE